MKFSIKNLAFVAMAATAVTLTSCDPDDTPVDLRATNRAPTLSLKNQTDMSDFSGRAANLPRNTFFEVALVASDPDANLRILSVTRNGQEVGAGTTDVELQDGMNTLPLTSNRVLITGSEKGGFTKRLRLKAPDFSDSATYVITVRDTFDLEASVTAVLVSEKRPTPLFDEKGFTEVVFFNRSTPAGVNGAIDLDFGKSVSSSADTISELQDQGGATTWLKQVRAENGAVLRHIPATSENKNKERFNDVKSLEALLKLFDENKNENDLSPPLKKDDLLVVTRKLANGSTRYYLVHFQDINEGAIPAQQFYRVNIKRSL